MINGRFGARHSCSRQATVIQMNEHPLLRMWTDRLEVERAQEQARAARRAAREAEHANWEAAWRTYKSRVAQRLDRVTSTRWWDVLGWARWLLRLHAPGRPDSVSQRHSSIGRPCGSVDAMCPLRRPNFDL